ncbi:hypothetical protein M0811_14630 [Anaeramoeba ignava]|uniref:Uncharacterized protein n=1 Tax=Anaeramoeba ignava TaxID=1746090 RepID=A0A9Q0LUS4_ANAIG|nr:hypothetical protein M0811_14630 [Anaeramoeba ignava]
MLHSTLFFLLSGSIKDFCFSKCFSKGVCHNVDCYQSRRWIVTKVNFPDPTMNKSENDYIHFKKVVGVVTPGVI